MTQQMRVIFVSVASFLSACSSIQKKPEPAPAPVAVVQKAVIPVSAAKPAKPVNQLLCEHGSDKRIVVIETKTDAGCEVHYTKFGNSEKVASAVHTPTFCEEVKDKIRAHLEAGQFSCK